MNKYPEALTYSDWLETLIFKLPGNLILKILYFPFYLVGLIFVILTDGLGLIVIYLVFAPIYGIYLLFFTFKRMIVSQKKLMVIIDESNRKFVKVKNISNPKKDGFLFLNWELESKSKVDDLWKLSSGSKLFAKWESNKPVIPKVKEKESKTHEGFYLKLTGVTIGKRQENIKKIKSNDVLIYLREPLNPYDKNAILIKTKDGLDLGYIPKLSNSQLAENIDKGFKYRISVSVVTGTGNEYRGVNVLILQENQNLKSTQPSKQTSTPTKSFLESNDFDTPFLDFVNDDYGSIENSLTDSDDDGGYEPEPNIDFDSFDSDF